MPFDICNCDERWRGILNRIADKTEYVVLPGLTDVHVHLREPGFSYKETIYTGSRACAHGGFTTVCAMPNLKPCPDSIENLKKELEIIDRDSVIRILPYGTITKGELGTELAEFEELAQHVVAFSDDGHGVQNADMMLEAMSRAKKLNKLIVAHCEDNSLLNGGYIHNGEYAHINGHRGICSESEWRQIERDIDLARETGCGYHVCHISTKESVELIRCAKREGVNISCETAPHYLLMDDSFLKNDGRFKMNPPLRSKTDRYALIEGICDGTIDMIITDHAPHSAEEKSCGLEKSAMGVVGIETSFPLMYSYFVKRGIISFEKLLELMHYNPCRRFGINSGDDFTLFDLNEEYAIDSKDFLSKGKSTPFEGWRVNGRCLMTVSNNSIAYIAPEFGELAE